MQRRDFLQSSLQAALGLTLGAAVPWARAGVASTTLLAAWRQDARESIGLIELDGRHWRMRSQLVLPTRAHGLVVEADGSVLAAARRPGDWLLRWRPGEEKAQWQWIEDDRRFNGHVIASRGNASDGSTGQRFIWTTETELEDGQGLLGVRNAATLEKLDEWPTRGRDPHQLLALPQAVGGFTAGTLMVANGGIPTLPETGRAKLLDQRLKQQRMESSLAALHSETGEVLGQWRLSDPYLSIRHLAFDARSGRLGIALQAEHPDAAQRQAAPVLAVWDGRALRAAEGQPALQGYGGDIVALPQRLADRGGFAVSCARANALGLFSAEGRWQKTLPHPGAYALAGKEGHVWLGGDPDILEMDAPAQGSLPIAMLTQSGVRDWHWDNHWVVV